MKPRRSKPLSLAAFVASFACLIAFAAGSISTSATAATAPAGGGGLLVPDTPEISDVICLTGCSTMRTSSVGGTVQITGTAMDTVKTVAFRGTGKSIRVEPRQVTATRVVAMVPEGAASGRVRVIGSIGSVSEPSAQVIAIGAQVLSKGGALTITDASTTPTRAFQFGLRRPTLNFVVNGPGATTSLRVDVVNSAGDVVRSRFLTDVPTGSTQQVGWSGLVTGGKSAPNGSYRFVVRGGDGTAATLSKRLKRARQIARTSKSPRTANPFSFRMYGYIFPLRAAHSYGDGIGAGRGHQGADVLAPCGKPLVAARAGTVYYNDYQAGGAGNYLVINIRGGGGKSHVYMHMPVRSPLKVGARVKTGQRIGSVGTTGRSSACHLHFEVWSAPGWYQGGTFLDPMPYLNAWDRYS